MRLTLTLCSLTMLALVGCPTDDTSDTVDDTFVDTTPPTVEITPDATGIATGDVTFTFSFSENVGDSFTADDVTVTGASKGVFDASGTSATLVVSPPAEATGTATVQVAAGTFEDTSGNANADGANASIEFDTTTKPAQTLLEDFEGDPPGMVGFGGAGGNTVQDPTDSSNTVGELVKSDSAETWGGVTVGYCPGANLVPLPFEDGKTSLSLRVWSPSQGLPIMMKLEDSMDSDLFVEITATSTVDGDWETMTFDAASPSAGAFDLANTYDRLSIFPNFGTTGGDAGELTVYIDDLILMDIDFDADCPPVGSAEWPITFDDAETAYTLTGFGGMTEDTVIPDPASSGRGNVAKVAKGDSAEIWAGTTVGVLTGGLVPPIPFSTTNKTMTVDVWTDKTAIPIRLKPENSDDDGLFVELDATTSKTSEWETLTWTFADADPSITYDKISIFFDFGTSGADGGGGTFYFDNLTFVE